MNKPPVYVNARFQRRPLTGVERYAGEVLSRLSVPNRILEPRRVSRGISGHLWEQVVLPRRLRHETGGVGSRLLWSPANTGPLSWTPQVLTLHDTAPVVEPAWFSPLFARWYRWLLPRLVRRVDMVIVPSEFSRKEVITRLGAPASAVSVVPVGVDHDRFRPPKAGTIAQLRRRLELPERYILFVGTLQPRKNLPRLLAAWQQVQRKLDGWQLVIAGEHAPVFPAMDLGAINGVRLLGRVPETVLPLLYGGAALFVQPSLYEGAGLTILEAMASGCPVLAADNGALGEYLGDAGLLVDPRDVGAMVRALQLLVKDGGLREDLSIRGRKRAQAFTWDRTVQQIEVCFQIPSTVSSTR